MYININFLVAIIIIAVYAWYMAYQFKSLKKANKTLELDNIKTLAEVYNLYIAYNGHDEKAKELEDKLKRLLNELEVK